MVNLKGGTTISAASAPMGLISGYLLSDGSNAWVALLFVLLVLLSLLLTCATIIRYMVNFGRKRHLLASHRWQTKAYRIVKP